MKKLLFISLFLAFALSAVNAQEIPVSTPDSLKIAADTAKIVADELMVPADTAIVSAETEKKPAGKAKPSPETDNISKNFIKFNLTSVAMKNFSLQYERVLSRSVSGALSFSLMPETTIPYADQFIKMINKQQDEPIDAETEDIIRNLLVSSYTITPEVRFYLGKKRYSTGFYLSFFYRYGHYEVSNIPIPFTNELDEDITIETAGDITSHTGGFLLGYQWGLGKHMCLDWQIIGPHFGISKGDFLGLPTAPLSPKDQADIEEQFTDIDFPMLEPTVDATADKVTMLLDGPWGGIRFALSIGIKF
jgi:hypothetical protein